MYNCPSCQAPVAYGQDFCRNCGTALTWGNPQLYYCPSCSAPVTYGRATCGSCGTQLTWDTMQTSQTATGQSHGNQAEYGQAKEGSQTTQGQKKPPSQILKNIARKLLASIKKRPAVAATGLLLIVLVTGAVIVGMNWAAPVSSGKPGGAATTENPVTPPPAELAIMSFTAGPATIAPGESTTLQWNTSGALSITIDHGVGKVAVSGSLAVSPEENTTYTLTAADNAGYITKSTTVKVVPVTIPVISNFTSTPSAVQAGQSVTLQWDVAGARTISIDHGVGTIPASGSTAVTPLENTTYTLTATSLAGSRTATTTVTVSGISPPLISSFLASPPLIGPGQTSYLQWDIKGAKSASIDHGVGTVALNGSTPVSPSDNTTYTLTATNAAGSTIAKAIVSLTQSIPPVINSFTATPDTISPGQSSTLQWSVMGASTITLGGSIGGVPPTGTFPVSPTENATYTLTASNGNITVTASITVAVVTSKDLAITSFTAVPAVIYAGHSAELRWNVIGATSVSIEPSIGPVELSGTALVAPTTHTTYTLTASNNSVTKTATSHVTVSQSSVPSINSFTASPSTIHAGDQATLQWSVSDATAVSIDQGVGERSLSGTTTVNPSSNVIYTLTATSPSGSNTASAAVAVVAAGMPIISSFTATPSSITAGQSVTLDWAITGANSALIDHSIGTAPVPTGSITVPVSENTTFTLTANGSSGSASATAVVTVTP